MKWRKERVTTPSGLTDQATDGLLGEVRSFPVECTLRDDRTDRVLLHWPCTARMVVVSPSDVKVVYDYEITYVHNGKKPIDLVLEVRKDGEMFSLHRFGVLDGRGSSVALSGNGDRL